MSEYKERDAMQLDEAGNYYGKHVVAMTSESLHSKSDIAAELGYRDMVIDIITKQRDELVELLNEIVKLADPVGGNDWFVHEANELLSTIKEQK